MKRLPLAKGIGGVKRVESGRVIGWSESLLETPSVIRGRVIYSKGDTPLYRMAILVDNGVKAVLLEKGGRNYHPLILLKDAQVPAIAGIGSVSLDGKSVTVDSDKGIIYEGEVTPKERTRSVKEEHGEIPKTKAQVYVNVGYPSALDAAAKTEADGIGLVRTEFIAARTLSKILSRNIYRGVTVKQAIGKSSEADVIYAIAEHSGLRELLRDDLKHAILEALKCFGEKEVIVRTFDLARDEDDPLGNRGIRRCISEGGHSLRILAEAIKEALLEKRRGKWNVGVILPLVSHYSQIQTALEIILNTGLSLRENGIPSETGIKFGWEIEQPAASQNNEIWLEAFAKEYGHPPHFIGIGTNDLTQFTIALGRDAYSREKDQKVRKYLRKLYDESDFSVIRQICEVSRQCRRVGTRLFLLGEAAAERHYAQLMLSLGVVPSVAIESVIRVKQAAHEFEKTKSPQQVIEKYVDSVCGQYPPQTRDSLRLKLLQTLGEDSIRAEELGRSKKGRNM